MKGTAATASALSTSRMKWRRPSAAPWLVRWPVGRRCPATIATRGSLQFRKSVTNPPRSTARGGIRPSAGTFCLPAGRLNPFLRITWRGPRGFGTTFWRRKWWSAERLLVPVARTGAVIPGAGDRLCGRRTDLDRLPARHRAAGELPPARAGAAPDDVRCHPVPGLRRAVHHYAQHHPRPPHRAPPLRVRDGGDGHRRHLEPDVGHRGGDGVRAGLARDGVRPS